MTKALSAADVAAFLSEHPDFFSEHEDLLTNLQLPDSRKGTVSLVEKQIDVLRERRSEQPDLNELASIDADLDRARRADRSASRYRLRRHEAKH